MPQYVRRAERVRTDICRLRESDGAQLRSVQFEPGRRSHKRQRGPLCKAGFALDEPTAMLRIFVRTPPCTSRAGTEQAPQDDTGPRRCLVLLAHGCVVPVHSRQGRVPCHPVHASDAARTRQSSYGHKESTSTIKLVLTLCPYAASWSTQRFPSLRATDPGHQDIKITHWQPRMGSRGCGASRSGTS